MYREPGLTMILRRMATLASKIFTVEIANEFEPVSRASRRVVINANLLKQANLYAGDEVAITSSASPNVRTFTHLHFAVHVQMTS